jgi:Domain of unknown function (DUF4260)
MTPDASQVRSSAIDAAAGEAGATRPAGAVTGAPRTWLRVEGVAAFAAGIALYVGSGGQLIWLVPLMLAVDVSMAGYLAGPAIGAFTYNAAHTWATGLLVLAAGWAAASPVVVVVGAVLVAHVGLDRFVGYGLKYPSAFADTHLGRLKR